MITTEKEATRKICIHTRLRSSTQPGATAGYNRSKLTVRELAKEKAIGYFFPSYYHLTRGRYFRCAASGCMAWRWADSERGYCGEAGAPQAGHGAVAAPARLPEETRADGSSRGGDGALIVGTGAAVAVLVYVAMHWIP